MLSGFRQFIFRGNVLDLAVAVVLGGAFGAVVTALVKDVLTPLIALTICAALGPGVDRHHDCRPNLADQAVSGCLRPNMRLSRGGTRRC